MKRIAVLGSTGSIGRQALEVIRSLPERVKVVGLSAGRDAQALAEQAASFGVKRTALGSEEAVELARADDVDIVLNGIVGAAGLRASIAALEAGKTLALANKESLVAGGELCLDAAERGGGHIVPVDSEHAAIAQCLEGRDPASVARLVITASGGPFRTRSNLSEVTVEEALAHPTWSMGPKITVDSATLMNKGLEVIEAHHIFGFDFDRIDVVVHPQSIVHGIIELADGSLLMQAAATDMRLPIQAALLWPERFPSLAPRLDPATFGALDFEPIDHASFPAVRTAYDAGRKGATYPAVLNAANEVAVGAFLDGRIPFVRIVAVTQEVLDKHTPGRADRLDEIEAADAWARAETKRLTTGLVRT